MPATRQSLQRDVETRLARDDVDFDSILLVTEAELARDVRLVRQERFISLTCSAQLTALPDRFLSVRALWNPRESNREVTYRPLTVLHGLDVEARSLSGAIEYSLQGSDTGWDLVLAPPPTADVPLTLNLIYIQRLSTLMENADTHALLADYYDVMLWSCMMGGGTWLEDEELYNANKIRRDGAIDSVRRHETLLRIPAATGLVSSGSPRDIV